jgi:alpha-L-rhamnosidase
VPAIRTSFNHYALGAVADWLHRTVAGLVRVSGIGIAPESLRGLEHASATLDTPYGRACVGWHRDGDLLIMKAEVPANCSGEVHLPGNSESLAVGSGRHTWMVRGSTTVAARDART